MSKTTRNAPSSKALEHPLPMPVPPLSDAYKDLRVSVDRFCLLAGIEALAEMLARTRRPCAARVMPVRPSAGAIAGARPRASWPSRGRG